MGAGEGIRDGNGMSRVDERGVVVCSWKGRRVRVEGIPEGGVGWVLVGWRWSGGEVWIGSGKETGLMRARK